MTPTRKQLAVAALLVACAACCAGGPASSQPLASFAPALRPAVGVAVSVQTGGPVGLDFFYTNLARYGDWVQRPSVGWVWQPRHTRYGWRPYTYGHWAYTDYGWTWVSSESWGWATYHYGRWDYDPDYGWLWVPGTDWGPAWVSWQQGDGYIGWAPLPSSAVFDASVGSFSFGVSLPADHFCFVPERSFLAPSVASFIVPPARNVTIIRNTTNLTNYRFVNRRVINEGIPVRHIEQVTGRPVRALRVADVRTATVGGGRVRGNTVALFRPQVVKRAAAPPPVQARAATRISSSQLSRRQQGEAKALRSRQAAEAGQLARMHRQELKQQSAQQRREPARPEALGQRRSPPAPRVSQGSEKAAPARQSQTSRISREPNRREAPPPNRQAQNAELAQRHQAEMKALQEQHQRDSQVLAARHQREQAAVQQPRAEPQRQRAAQPPPQQHNRPQAAPAQGPAPQPEHRQPRRPDQPPPA